MTIKFSPSSKNTDKKRLCQKPQPRSGINMRFDFRLELLIVPFKSISKALEVISIAIDAFEKADILF